VNTDDIREQSRTKYEQNRNGHEKHRGSIFDGTCVSRQPTHRHLTRKQQDKNPPNANQQDPQRSQARPSVDERNAECQECPPDDIVSYAGGKHDDSNCGIEEFEFRENATENGESRDRECDACE
jgi:hypothetical protein